MFNRILLCWKIQRVKQKDPQTTSDEHPLDLHLNTIEQWHQHIEGEGYALSVKVYHLHNNTRKRKGPMQGVNLRYTMHL